MNHLTNALYNEERKLFVFLNMRYCFINHFQIRVLIMCNKILSCKISGLTSLSPF